MRARSLGLFFAGFTTGVVLLTAALWAGGALHKAQPPRPAAQAIAERSALPASSPAPAPALPDTNPAHQPKPPVAVPPVTDGQAANPVAPPELAARHLLIPVAGVRPQNLTDTFDQARAAGRSHDAIDIMAPRGTPVVAADQGNVAKLFTSKDGGLTVYQFDDSRQWCYYYAHLDHYEPGLKEGVLLRKGDRLGYVGSTGNASPNAPHLHFAIYRVGPDQRWWEGTPINPFPLLAAAAP